MTTRATVQVKALAAADKEGAIRILGVLGRQVSVFEEKEK